MHETVFVFRGELTVDDPRMQAVTGYLCTTSGLLVKLKQQECNSMPAGVAISSGTIDNPTFYTQYDSATGAVSILSTYWTQQLAQGRVIEKFTSLDLSLSREEELAVISAIEAHCQKEYGKSCTEFLNELRREEGLPQLPDRKGEQIEVSSRPSIDSLIQSAKTKAGCTTKNTDQNLNPQFFHSRV